MQISPSHVIHLLFIAAGIVALVLVASPRNMPPSLNGAIYGDETLPIDARVNDLLVHMTLEEKIGQMALVEKNSVHELDDVATYGLGAILSGAGGKPENNTPEGWRAMIGQFTNASRSSRIGIPILYGVDANHGNGNVPDATIFPHALGLGATRDPELVEHIARATAEESLATGAQWNFSPSLDLPTDIRWGRIYEAFSDDPELAGELGAAYIRGLQEFTPAVAAAAKHYIGAGSMAWQTSSNKDFFIDQGITPPDEKTLRDAYLPPFQRAIEANALSIMTGLNAWGDTKVSASRYLLTDVLKNELHFNGFVVSDWYGIYEIAPGTYDSTVTAINAGVDMVMLPYDYVQFISDVKKAVGRGAISESRIDDAARRILRAKFALGLFDADDAAVDLSVIGSELHRALAREAVGKSLVLLKNDDSILPLSIHSKKIRIAGSAADNIGMQSGAWTVEWQGVDGNWLPGATSILAGIRQATGPDAIVQYDKDGTFAEKDIADIGIAIVGEKPYAEGWGDAANPTLSADDMAAIKRLRASTRHLIVILISGRPLIITDDISNWDALVASWLPGSEGEGVADALFGNVPFGGKLPMYWPRSIKQLPFDWTDSSASARPLFPRGFGLTTESLKNPKSNR
ncbi:MAG: beta-glucosidase [Parcubacteria group bacterium Gr01-1014_8]|nr:MAG: beta-glucosidase [Parcubacteria group bacterium Gr01-1014_8]